MKMRYTFTFDPEVLAPKEVRTALEGIGITDIHVNMSVEKTAKSKPKAKDKTTS